MELRYAANANIEFHFYSIFIHPRNKYFHFSSAVDRMATSAQKLPRSDSPIAVRYLYDMRPLYTFSSLPSTFPVSSEKGKGTRRATFVFPIVIVVDVTINWISRHSFELERGTTNSSVVREMNARQSRTARDRINMKSVKQISERVAERSWQEATLWTIAGLSLYQRDQRCIELPVLPSSRRPVSEDKITVYAYATRPVVH